MNTNIIEYAIYPLLPSDIQIIIFKKYNSKLFMLIDVFNINVIDYDLYYNIYENNLLKTCYHFKYSNPSGLSNTSSMILYCVYHYIYRNNKLINVISCSNGLCLYKVEYLNNQVNIGSNTYQFDSKNNNFIMVDKLKRMFFKYFSNQIKIITNCGSVSIYNLSHININNNKNHKNNNNNNNNNTNVIRNSNNNTTIYYKNHNEYVQVLENKYNIHWYNDIIKLTIKQLKHKILPVFNNNITNNNDLLIQFIKVDFNENSILIHYLYNNHEQTKLIEYNTHQAIFYFEN